MLGHASGSRQGKTTMRMICPNCGAQYEVADDIIPDAGRDVQCSNCGHTWFEKPGASVQDEHAPHDDPRQDAPPLEHPQTSEPEPEPQPKVEQQPEPEQTSDPEPAPEPKRRSLDPEVTDILRQEAEYEQAARAADADPIETQPEMDLSQNPDDDRRTTEARNRLARLRGEQDVAANTAAAAAVGAMMAADDAPRRQLLPDIEEINSTLRPDATPSATDAHEPDTPTRSGFLQGFRSVIVLALIALALYTFAPQISAAVPQTEPVLTAYVGWVDGMRLWLDAQIGSLLERANDGADGENS